MKVEKSGKNKRNPDGTFKSGEDWTGNRKGRPKGRRNYAMVYADAMEALAEEKGMGAEELEDLLIKVAYKKAQKGDFNFYRDLQDRLHGKPQQHFDHTSDGKSIVVSFDPTFNETEDDATTQDPETGK